MYVKDVKPDRWRRSVQFLRAFAEALSWKGDRVALALFAHPAAPQVRLTKDPERALLLPRSPRRPFAVPARRRPDVGHEHRRRASTGACKLVEKDEELFGKSRRTRKRSSSSRTARRGRATWRTRCMAGAPAAHPGLRGRRRDHRRRADSRSPARRRHDARADGPRRFSIESRSRRSPAPAAASISRWAANPIATSRSGSSTA